MKRILWIALIQFVLVAVFWSEAQAQERRSFYTGTRCLGMGGACIAVVNDETALLVNPAALGKLRDYYGTIFDPEMELGDIVPQGNPFVLEDVLASLKERPTTLYHAKAQVLPSFVARNFGIGLYGNYILDAEMSADSSTVNTYYRNDLAAVLGFNFRFWGGRIKLGANTKLINRIEVPQSVLSTSGSLSYKDIASEGVGLSTDVGLIFAAPWTFLPTVTAVLRDVGDTHFDKTHGVRLETADRPSVVKQDLDVAVALFPMHSGYVRSSWTVEYRGLLTAEDETDKAKLLHAGAEFNFGDVFFLRAGYNQRYWTAGLELASERYQWQFATYGEEIGNQDNPREDRRYNLKFSYRF